MDHAAAHEQIVKIMSTSKVMQHLTHVQYLNMPSVEGLKGDQASVEEMKDILLERRDYMAETINSIKGLSCRKPEGAFL